ncbi:hypothetical protein WOLCODRAFT_158908 [Wolfiporia cocos MD-104 SS10]|uniref:Uncharacterized protein n=1 Tax=Wolfiporia cocos (strain MD-104) TaxID=742152 RepID=A0A2H3JRQ0_WOLCO|nr:hypothetical protein WOLCODRAFT_158908 [Wolfiporia cocos MD-104 SS10]
MDLPNWLIQLLPEAYRHIFYEEKHEWRDPPAGFFMKGGYLTIPTPDRITPTWVQVPPSSNDPWDQTRATFEQFGTVADLMTPTLTIHQADGQQQGGQMTNTTGGTMGVASTALGSSTTPGGGSASQSAGGERLEEEAFLEGEVPRAVEAIQQVAREAIQEDRQVEEARRVEEARQVEEAHQEAQQEEAPTTRNQPEGTA